MTYDHTVHKDGSKIANIHLNEYCTRELMHGALTTADTYDICLHIINFESSKYAVYGFWQDNIQQQQKYWNISCYKTLKINLSS